MQLDFSATGRTRVLVGTVLSTAFCVAAALFVDSFNFHLLSDAARLRSITTDIALPIVLATPLTYFFLSKLRELAASRNRLEATLGAMAQGLSLFDSESRLMLWNQKYGELFGMPPKSLSTGMRLADILSIQKGAGNFDGDPADLEARLVQRMAQGEPLGNEVRLASGRLIYSMHMPAPGGGWVATHDDITEIREQNLRLERQKEQLQAVLDHMNQGVTMFDGEGRMVMCNGFFEKLYRLPPRLAEFGMDREVLVHRMLEAGAVPQSAARDNPFVAHDGRKCEQLIQCPDGRYLRVVSSPMRNGGVVVTHEDVTERRAIETQIEHDALHDALTGLANRRYLERELERRRQECRTNGRTLGMLHIDLDRFKQVNDTLGHSVGDLMLVHTAQILAAGVGPGDFVARIGGDEFVVVTSEAKDRRRLNGLARRLASRLRKPLLHDGAESVIDSSIGIACERGPEIDVPRLMVNADLALHASKTSGRARITHYDEAMKQSFTQSKLLADQLRRGLERGEFVPYFQPKVDARSRQICGLEALVRWNHPERGLMVPGEFLPVAEELGLVALIDSQVLTRTVAQISDWRARGLSVPRVSVNVSALRLRDPALPRQIQQLQIPPGQLAFELLESIHLDNLDDVVAWNLDQIRELGVDIEIDDFGTGRASLLALLRLRPSKLKIDRQFTAPLAVSESARQLVRWILDVGHALNAKVVAEGVEDEEQAALLTSYGCDELQGYYFERAIDAADTARMLARGGEWSLTALSA